MIWATLCGDAMRKQRLNDIVEQDSMISSATGDQGREKSGKARAVRDSWRDWNMILGLEDWCGKSILGEENNIWRDNEKGSKHFKMQGTWLEYGANWAGEISSD